MSGIGYGGVVDYAPVTSATATREMAVTGMGDGGVCVGGPSLVLNFGASPTGTTPTLDPRITFSRASNATYFGSTGTLQYAPHNLLTYSEQFDNSYWGVTAGTVSPNATAAPDGTTTADRLIETAGTGLLPRFPVAVTLLATFYSVSVYAKEVPGSSKRYLQMYFNAAFSGALPGANFDLATGTATFTNAGATTSVENVGNGWWRCTVITPVSTAGGSGLRIALVDSPTQAMSVGYNPDGTGSMYFWGAQLNVGALQPYYSTTVKNLQGYSQEFDNAAWTKTNSFVQINQIRNNTMQGAVAGTPGTLPTNWAIASPSGLSSQIVGTGTDGGITYIDLRIFGTTTGTLFALNFESTTQIAAAQNQTWTGSLFATYSAGSLANVGTLSVTVVERNNVGGALTTKTSAETLLNTALLSNRFSTSYTLPSATAAYVSVRYDLNLTNGAAVDVTLRIGLPQLVQGAVVGNPTPTYGAARALTYTAPDGSLTADKLAEDTATAGHYLGPATTITGVVGQVLTHSCYVKAAERTFVQLILTGIAPASGNYIAGFDLSTGVAGTPTSGVTSSITNVGNGWYRCRMTVTVQTAASVGRQIRVSQNSSSTPSSYTGDGTSGIYVWGAQLSDSGSLDAYTYNPVAAPSAAAYYGPRIEYDPTTLAVKGLLIEEQRTNSLRNNMMQGVVAGTPGTNPTYWVMPGAVSGLTQQIVGTGTENGITYIDVRYSGTTTTAGSHAISFEAANQIAAASGQTWTRSAWFKIVAGSTANLTSLIHNLQGRNAANTAFTETFSTDIAPSLTSTLTRFSTTSTLADPNTAFARSQIAYVYNNGVAIDLTLRIGLPQFEQGAFATSVIPTSTTALTRSADVTSMLGANFSNWYNPIEGTMVVNAAVTATTTDATTRVLASIGDSATFNETIYLARAASATNVTANVVDNGSAQWASNTLGTATVNVPFKVSMAYKLNDLGGSFNGAAAVTDTSATLPTVNTLTLGVGSWSGSNNYMNGYIRSFSYYPSRLPNSTLQGLTS